MSSGDHIEVRRIRVDGQHGALEGEQDLAQPFEVDLDIYLDLSLAQLTDDLSSTVDYGEITLAVIQIVTTTRFVLLEALAGAIADAILLDSRIERVEVSLRKMAPPIPADLHSVGVRIARAKSPR
ncbi:MAG TPA: dihydroneopterin aldolase [Acidimicrobiales bacterium]|nr:dihydroneopterin aldolase [Acidimicrobiales bacterium]